MCDCNSSCDCGSFCDLYAKRLKVGCLDVKRDSRFREDLLVEGQLRACNLSTQSITPCVPGTSLVINGNLNVTGTITGGGINPPPSCDITVNNISPCVGDTVFVRSELAVAPIAPNTASIIRADDGTSADISLIVAPKGLGSFSISEVGNVRGNNAVDLQTARALATQVASGVGSFVANVNNTASGPNSSALGLGNVASAGSATAMGGSNNIASGTNSGVFAGVGNVASGINSGIFVSDSSTVSGVQSIAVGGAAHSIAGIRSFGAGFGTNILSNDTFVWGGSGAPFTTTSTASREVIFNLLPVSYAPPALPGTFFVNGDFTVTGAKAFTTSHSLDPSKCIQHFSVEAPGVDLMYRGCNKLVNGQIVVDIDETYKLTPGTFGSLTEKHQIYLTNKSNWDLVRVENEGTLYTGKFRILSNNPLSNAEVNWIVLATRKGFDRPIEIPANVDITTIQ